MASNSAPEHSPRAAAARGVADGSPVLVVEDDDAIRACIVGILEDEGYAVVAARTGLEALSAVAIDPVAILLDLRMPDLDGSEFVRRYHRAAAAPAPIVVVSAEWDGPARARQLRAGYVGKPFDLETLVAAVRRAVDEAARRTTGGRRAA